MNNAGRAAPCARAPLTGAELGRRTFMRLQRISRRSTGKDAERTKGENRQEAKHGQILPTPSRQARARSRSGESATYPARSASKKWAAKMPTLTNARNAT